MYIQKKGFGLISLIIIIAIVGFVFLYKDSTGKTYITKVSDMFNQGKATAENKIEGTKDIMKERDRQIQTEVDQIP